MSWLIIVVIITAIWLLRLEGNQLDVLLSVLFFHALAILANMGREDGK